MLKSLKKLLIVSGSFTVIFFTLFVMTATSGNPKNQIKAVNSTDVQSDSSIVVDNSQSATSSYTPKYTLPEVEVTEEEENTYSSSKATQTVTVERVIDGDTFVYNDENGVEQTLRMIGIDTPESVHYIKSKNCKYGKIASEYTKKILTGKTVKLEFDESMRDDYQRILAYVYIDDVMINYDLVAKGYAVAKEFPPNTKYAELFKNAQIEAEKNKIGMWDKSVTDKDCNLKTEYYIEY